MLPNPTKLAYYVDYFWTLHADSNYPDNTITNHDYFISQKAFFFDLDSWGDEAPNDDPNQPLGTDLSSLQEIFFCQIYPSFISLAVSGILLTQSP